MEPDATTVNDGIARLKTDAEAIFRAGLRAVDPVTAVQRACERDGHRLRLHHQEFDLQQIQRVVVVGAGKATAAMARAVEDLLGERIDEGLISVKYDHTLPLKHITTIEAGHPLPDANGVQAARRILTMTRNAQADDLVIVLLSGGGSALLPLPIANIALEEKQSTTERLLACGATIQEINAVRKHLSAIKGGRLARAAAPATVATLMLSDVVGDQMDVIASGPTVADPTTFSDCLDIIQRYGIQAHLPSSVRCLLAEGAAGRIAETPKTTTHDWGHVYNGIVGSNTLAVQAAAEYAGRLGYHPLVLTCQLEGDTRTVAKVHAAIARQATATGQPVDPPACILSGGETTVVVKGGGKGGRNQEFALAAALAIDGAPPMVILSAGTDGTDGPTDAAGAFADPTTVQRAFRAGIDIHRHQAENDAYPLFDALGDLLVTGPTGTNVMDLNIILVGSRK